MNNREKGQYGEDKAVEYLINNNYEIIERNYRVKKIGEIDIIAFKNNKFIFIEVKYRNSNLFGEPAEAVNYKKVAKIRKIALIFLQNKKLFNQDIGFDVIEIINNRKLEIRHIINAF